MVFRFLIALLISSQPKILKILLKKFSRLREKLIKGIRATMKK
jgi:hypothetical protein